jgi:hypothetical protein
MSPIFSWLKDPVGLGGLESPGELGVQCQGMGNAIFCDALPYQFMALLVAGMNSTTSRMLAINHPPIQQRPIYMSQYKFVLRCKGRG